MPRLVMLDQRGELTTAHVRLVARALGPIRTGGVAMDRRGPRHRPARPNFRERYAITPEIRRLLVQCGGNASAVHRRSAKRALNDSRVPKAPSLATFHRALRQTQLPGTGPGSPTAKPPDGPSTCTEHDRWNTATPPGKATTSAFPYRYRSRTNSLDRG